jgi:hypothetical protein
MTLYQENMRIKKRGKTIFGVTCVIQYHYIYYHAKAYYFGANKDTLTIHTGKSAWCVNVPAELPETGKR